MIRLMRFGWLRAYPRKCRLSSSASIHLGREIRVFTVCLRQTIGDFVVISFVCTEDMRLQVQSGRSIKRSRENRDVLPRPIPEEVRAAIRTEAPLGRVRRCVPSDVTRDLDRLSERGGCGDMMPAGFAALLAVARDDWAQSSIDDVANCAAQAGTGCFRHFRTEALHRAMSSSFGKRERTSRLGKRRLP